MSNILGGKTESKAEIPEYAQQASKEAIALAKQIGGMDYTDHLSRQLPQQADNPCRERWTLRRHLVWPPKAWM